MSLKFKELYPRASQQLLDEHLHPVDLLFAEKIAGQFASEASFLFLAHLLKSAREGDLCLTVKDPELLEGAARLMHLKEIVCHEGRWYLHQNWECEKRFLTHLERVRQDKPRLRINRELLARQLEQEPLEVEQKEAILNAADHTLSLICGGPGTGKTFTAKVLVRLFLEHANQEVVLAAPTGKAASNLRSIDSRCKVQTLHSLLRRPLTADLILIDEASMIDAHLMADLFASVKEGARLILIGDKDQLPPVESGNFFADLAAASTNMVQLKKCLRSDLREIIEMAENIKVGKPVPFQPLPDPRRVQQEIKARFPEVRTLSPFRKGPYGIDQLNQALFSTSDGEIPIMITVNDPVQNLFNGDTAFLVKKTGMARFADGREISEYLLPRYEYAYVLSVHKSQGSEYEKILILLPKGSEVFGRELLYTAVTRAKKRVEIWADEGVMEALVAKRTKRLSSLS